MTINMAMAKKPFQLNDASSIFVKSEQKTTPLAAA